MSSQEAMDAQKGLWWGCAGPAWSPLSASEQAAVDASCRKFALLVRAAGRGELDEDPRWGGTAEGLFAQVILCDQISRNAFRGTAEAFATDARAMALVRHLLADDAGLAAACGEGKAHVLFLSTPVQHSEAPADHALGARLMAAAESAFGAEDAFVEGIRGQLESHREVVGRFGRYPHRNAALGRPSTAEEAAWLTDTENLPSWAKSQMK